jgi:capsular exopolysaccharide synthesis family protein
VYRSLSLFLHPEVRSDIMVFERFMLGDSAVFGQYELDVDRGRQRWTLIRRPQAVVVDSGTAADSVGRVVGFRYRIPDWVYTAGENPRKIRFTVTTPREAAVALTSRVGATLPPTSNFLLLTFRDRDPRLAARILNTWIDEYVGVAATYKKRKLAEAARILESQLQTQKAALDSADYALQTFRVGTITQPSDQGPIVAGVQESRDPVIRDYFTKRIEYDDIRGDVNLLRTLIASLAKETVPGEALLQVRSATSGAPVAQQLRQAIIDYHATENALAQLRVSLTDEHPAVKEQLARLNTLKHEKIPQYANELLASLRLRELDDSVRIASADENLRRIPQRTIDEEKLRRVRDAAASLYTDLQARSVNADLAEASAAPDVSVLDSAIAPITPTKNTQPRVMLVAIVGGFAAAFALAILLDKLDNRVRYPDQVTDDLGMPIAGTVPRLPTALDDQSPEQMFQLVESFRTLRLAVTNALGHHVSLAVSSPSPADGKSLISMNLAMSFAESGLRTVLVDGDTRRGSLHHTFGLTESPGLTDVLSQRVYLRGAIRPTSHERLGFISRGARRKRSPELLTSRQLPDLLEELRRMYDVVVVDTPPLAAGIDGYAISAAAGALLIVLRTGKTNRRMAAEKLRPFERLPVDIVGAVLNGVPLTGAYAYYGYVSGYEALDGAPAAGVSRVR